MTDPDTSQEAVERLAQDCDQMQRDHDRETEEARHHHDTAATLRALSAELAEMTRRRNRWKAIAEGQDFTRVYLETCAERDALRAGLVSTLSAAILDAQMRVIENQQMDTPDQIRANARAFLARHQKETGA